LSELGLKETMCHMTTLTLCLARHGETDWNAENRIQGQLDIPLNSRGQEQAKALSSVLATMHFDAIYSSDLSRASVTAAAIANELGLELKINPALRERHYGSFQGLTYAEVGQKTPEGLKRFLARELDYEMEGGESLNTLWTRCVSQLQAMADAHPNQTILVVSHGAVLDTVYRYLVGDALDAPRSVTTPNCALNWMTYSDGKWKLDVWGEVSHVADALDALPE
jgi:probable phosphoglycerate mutase